MNISIITAAGKGQRAGGSIKKQFIPICGKPVLTHTIERFLNNTLIDAVIVVLAEEDIATYAVPINASKLLLKTIGGEKRADSVYNGLKASEKVFNAQKTGKNERIVLIHDGVRPVVSNRLIDTVIKTVLNTGAAIPAQAVIDTVIWSDKGRVITGYRERNDLYLVQTPQAYRLSIIMDAYTAAGTEASDAGDESWLVFNNGYAVSLVAGEKENIKITTPEDFLLAEYYLKSKSDINQ